MFVGRNREEQGYRYCRGHSRSDDDGRSTRHLRDNNIGFVIVSQSNGKRLKHIVREGLLQCRGGIQERERR